MVDRAFNDGFIDPTITEAILVLVPKIEAPSRFKEYRPISLCNVSIKIISKVLVNRLCPLLGNIIGPLQSSFIADRGTVKKAVIAQEVVNYMHKLKGKT
jgi:hypothetical protein